MKTAAFLLASVVIASSAVAKEKRGVPKVSGDNWTGYHIWTANTHTHIPPRPRGPGWFLTCSTSGRVQTCMWLK